MAATGTAATGRLLVLLLLGLTAPAAALAGYIEVGSVRAPERSLLRPPWERGLQGGWRAAGSWTCQGRDGHAEGGGGPALRRIWRALTRPCLPQCLALEVGLPPPPQRPNERHRDCGDGGPPRAPQPPSCPLRCHLLGGPRASSLGTMRVSGCSFGPRSGLGLRGAARSSRTVMGFSPGSGRCSFCWRGGLRCRMQLPVLVRGSPAVSGERACAAR